MNITDKDRACLQSQKTISNFVPDPSKVWEEIDNYRNFYAGKGVGKAEIFYGACVDSQMLAKLCVNPKIKIYIAKEGTSSVPNEFEEFKFIIMGADDEGYTVIEKSDVQLPNYDCLDKCCCKNPPKGKP